MLRRLCPFCQLGKNEKSLLFACSSCRMDFVKSMLSFFSCLAKWKIRNFQFHRFSLIFFPKKQVLTKTPLIWGVLGALKNKSGYYLQRKRCQTPDVYKAVDTSKSLEVHPQKQFFNTWWDIQGYTRISFAKTFDLETFFRWVSK